MTDDVKNTHPEASDDGVHPAAKPFLWLDHPLTKAIPLYLFGGLAGLMLLLEFLNPFHAVSKYDDVFGFYEIEGFVGFCLAVLMGWPLRRLLGRPENYYDQEGDHD